MSLPYYDEWPVPGLDLRVSGYMFFEAKDRKFVCDWLIEKAGSRGVRAAVAFLEEAKRRVTARARIVGIFAQSYELSGNVDASIQDALDALSTA